MDLMEVDNENSALAKYMTNNYVDFKKSNEEFQAYKKSYAEMLQKLVDMDIQISETQPQRSIEDTGVSRAAIALSQRVFASLVDVHDQCYALMEKREKFLQMQSSQETASEPSETSENDRKRKNSESSNAEEVPSKKPNEEGN